MTIGFLGELAKKYYGLIEDSLETSHIAIKNTPTHIEGVEQAEMLFSPYTPENAVFVSDESSNNGTSNYVVADYEAYGNYLYIIRRFLSESRGTAAYIDNRNDESK